MEAKATQLRERHGAVVVRIFFRYLSISATLAAKSLPFSGEAPPGSGGETTIYGGEGAQRR